MSSGKTVPKKNTKKKSDAANDAKIVITGIAGNLGRSLASKLHTDYPIIGIDQRPFRGKPKDLKHYQLDIRRRKAEDIFRHENIRAVVHLGMVHRPIPGRTTYRDWNVLGTIKLLEYCRRYDISKVVLMSTAYVYGHQPANSNFLTEDAPLLGSADYPEMRALIEWDMYAQSFFWKHPHVQTVILRPVHVVGPTVRNAPSNYLRMKRPIMMIGFDPMVQLLHEQDLINAILLALEPDKRGVFNIVGPGEVPLSAVHKELDKTPLGVPPVVTNMVVKKLWRWGFSPLPPGELPHLQFQCLVDGSEARKTLGFRPRYTMRQTIRSVLE
jgi:UDP-glucose 4-epimerase